MRRIVLILVLVVVVGIAGYVLLRPKSPPKSKRKSSQSTDSTGKSSPARPSSVRGGRVSGKLRTKSSDERKSEARRIRDEERRRKRELRRQERERRRMLREARKRRGKRKGRKGQFYVVKAIVSLGSESYALVDGRRVQVGDVVMGRRIAAILQDRIVIEAFGKQSSVRVGESLLPATYSPRKR